MIRIKQLVLSILFSFLTLPLLAQVEMADRMRSEGKIYVVVAIIFIVLGGMFLYLFLIDKKVKRLEEVLKNREEQTK